MSAGVLLQTRGLKDGSELICRHASPSLVGDSEHLTLGAMSELTRRRRERKTRNTFGFCLQAMTAAV